MTCTNKSYIYLTTSSCLKSISKFFMSVIKWWISNCISLLVFKTDFVLTSVRSILFCRSATSLAMSSSDSLSPRSTSCQQHKQAHYSAVDIHRFKIIRPSDCGDPYLSSTFLSSLFFELLNCMQEASVVSDTVHSGVFLILFRVHVSQQLNYVNVFFLLWALLLWWSSENKEMSNIFKDK